MTLVMNSKNSEIVWNEKYFLLTCLFVGKIPNRK